jgi:hypothetical protein
MKTSLQNDLIPPALFRLAAFIENPLAPRFFESSPDITEEAFASLRSEASKSPENKNSPAANTRTKGISKPHPTRSAATKNEVAQKCAGHPPVNLKPAEFHLRAPSAKSVKLAADFTEWEKFPLDMIKSVDGVWFTMVPLPPGHYSYRFIVDGQWRDDPRPNQRVSNSFGTANTLVEVG